jgi:hypothetical protein
VGRRASILIEYQSRVNNASRPRSGGAMQTVILRGLFSPEKSRGMRLHSMQLDQIVGDCRNGLFLSALPQSWILDQPVR